MLARMGMRGMTERADGTHLAWERNGLSDSCLLGSHRMSRPEWRIGNDDLFGITTGVKSAWRAKKSECIKGGDDLGELNRRGI